jgi:TPR repeat protein
MKAKKAPRGIYSVVDPTTPWKLPRLDSGSPKYFYTMTAAEWRTLLQKASQGDAEAEYLAAIYYNHGCKDKRGRVVVRRSARTAAEWFQQSAEHGNADAQCYFGVILSDGIGRKKNPHEGLLRMKRAFRRGNTSSAPNNIAVTYREIGNMRLAVQWFRKAVALGDVGDHVQLGIHSYWGKGTPADHIAAVDHFRKATNGKNMAEFDRDDANFYLAIAYLEGKGVKKSLAMARKYLERANRDNDHLATQRLLKQIDRGI